MKNNTTYDNDYYKCIIKGILLDNNIDSDIFYTQLENHIKNIIAEHIEIDIIGIIKEVMEYTASIRH